MAVGDGTLLGLGLALGLGSGVDVGVGLGLGLGAGFGVWLGFGLGRGVRAGGGVGIGGCDPGTGSVGAGCDAGLGARAAGDPSWAPPWRWRGGRALLAVSAGSGRRCGSATSPPRDARGGWPWPVTRESIVAAAPASMASVTATASPQDTAPAGNPSAHARHVTTGACRRTFSPAYSAMPAAQVKPPAAASTIAVMASARINRAPAGEPVVPRQRHCVNVHAGEAVPLGLTRPDTPVVQSGGARIDTTPRISGTWFGQVPEPRSAVAAVRPPGIRNTPVRIRGDSTLVQTHGDLPASPEHVLCPSAAARQRLPLPGTAARSSATSLDASLALALMLALHPRSRPWPARLSCASRPGRPRRITALCCRLCRRAAACHRRRSRRAWR